MERINLENTKSDFSRDEVKDNVELVKKAIGHLDQDTFNVVLLAAIVENNHEHAKQSEEYKQAAEKFGTAPAWGGGEIQAKCGPYLVNVTMKHDTGSMLKEALAKAIAEGKNPLEFLAGMLGDDDEPCDCPNCRAERGEGSTH